MDKERLNILFQRYLDNSATAEELRELDIVLGDPAQQTALREVLGDSYSTMPENLIKDMSGTLAKERTFEHIVGYPQQKKTIILWPRIAVAAAVAVIVFGAGLFYFNKDTKKVQQTAYVQDINPGIRSATLTLANGKTIRLSGAKNGELAREAGVAVTKSKDGQLIYEIRDNGGEEVVVNTLSTANGETYQVRLPDGSFVWLNAASSLTYATSLMEKGKRIVKLRGEGYFEIAKDKAHPFIVQTDKQDVEVLGTHFNINSYSDEPAVKTTLLEGSVKVTVLDNKASKTLKPGEQSSLNTDGLKITEVDLEDATAWKEGYILFEGETLVEIMRKVSRWYNVEVEFKDESVKTKRYFGSVSRLVKLSEVLKRLQVVQPVKLTLEGRTIIAEQK